MTRAPLHMLWQGQSAIICGTLSDCLREADKLGLLTPQSDGYYSIDGADIQVYPAGGHIGWVTADEVEAALREPP